MVKFQESQQIINWGFLDYLILKSITWLPTNATSVLDTDWPIITPSIKPKLLFLKEKIAHHGF